MVSSAKATQMPFDNDFIFIVFFLFHLIFFSFFNLFVKLSWILRFFLVDSSTVQKNMGQPTCHARSGARRPFTTCR